ncbi:MAG: methyltransferase domain-containing protein [Candidatus Thermoplasmatota archaeon]|nr:methyltransferase domain-containing protein [Candidatus Thermoplasmatota archaeon]
MISPKVRNENQGLIANFQCTLMDSGSSEDIPLFDLIANQYDNTREPLRKEVLDFLVKNLSDSKDILEIGAGTGRISIPLQDSGFDITGVDISEKMLEKARIKGLRKAIIAKADHLPLMDNSFDVTLIVHVFHLLNDRKTVMEEALRVSRKAVMSLIRIGGRNPDYPERRDKISSALRNTASNYGINLDRKRQTNNLRGFESSVIEEFPPDRMLKIGTFISELTRDKIAIKMLSSSRFIRSVRPLSSKTLKDLETEFLKEVSGMEDFSIKRKSTEYLVIWEKSKSDVID